MKPSGFCCESWIFGDGKVYAGTREHSYVDPKSRGAPFVCLDLETGEEIFRIDEKVNDYQKLLNFFEDSRDNGSFHMGFFFFSKRKRPSETAETMMIEAPEVKL